MSVSKKSKIHVHIGHLSNNQESSNINQPRKDDTVSVFVVAIILRHQLRKKIMDEANFLYCESHGKQGLSMRKVEGICGSFGRNGETNMLLRHLVAEGRLDIKHTGKSVEFISTEEGLKGCGV